MNIDGVLQVYSRYEFPRHMMIRMPEEKIKAIIRRELAIKLAEHLLSLLDADDPMPDIVNYEVEQLRRFDVERHTVRFNLISDAELHRLKKVEQLYERMSSLAGLV